MERFLEYFVPERYDLTLKIDKGAKTIGGTVKIFGEAKAENVKFHAVGLSVDSVLVNGEKADFETADGVLTLSKAPRGDLCIEVGYHGSLNENMQGAYISTYEYEGHTETIVATQFESHYAREAFPCIDEPAAKAVFVLNIETTDKDDLILTNVGLGEPTPRMSTYLLAFVIGKFHGKTVKNAHGTEITTYCALNQDVNAVDFANEIAAKSLEFYDDNFGVEYPLPKLTQVALPDFEAGAMENWGLVTYRETMLLVTDAATLSTKKSVALTVAHELSHQWFGDLVTMAWWDDLWLNESFASVMEYYAVDYIHPEYKIFEGFFTGDCLAALKRDAYSGVQSVHQDVHNPAEIATLFDPAIVYSKGARLMLMTIRAMGWGNFCKGIKAYFEKYQYKNAVGDDLWRELYPYAGFDVEKMMHAFIDLPGYPVLTNAGKDFDKYVQKRFLLDGEMEESDWPIARVTEDMSGHYVLNLNDAEFEARLGEFETLGLEEKLRILIDRELVTKTELSPSVSLLPLLQQFRNENSAAIWNIIATTVAGLKVFFEVDSAEEKLFKKYVRDLIDLKLNEVGVKTSENDDENTIRLRANLLALAFYAEDMDVLNELALMYDADFAKMDAEIRSNILDAKVYLEPRYVDEYIEAYKKTADPEIKFDVLFATTLVKDKNELSKLVKMLGEPEVVKPQDQFYLYIWLYRNHYAREMAFSWLMENWEYVKRISGDKSLDNYPRYMAGSIKTAEDFEAYKKFFEPMREEPALSRAIEIGCREIEARLKLISDDAEAVKAWIRARES